jgi:tetratricopeptide (TPR) repeat protein
MKRALLVTALLVLTAVGAALAYHALTREHDYRAFLERGDEALRGDQTYGALEAYDGAIALRPDSMLAHLRRAETYLRRGDLERAAQGFRRAATLDPTATRPLDELGDVEYERQRFALAAQAYERYVQLDDRSPRVMYKLALAQYRAHNIDDAIAALEQTIRQNDRMTDAFYLLGLAYHDKGRLAAARRAFEMAISWSPGLVPAREELADIYGALGRRADELEQLQLLAGLDRDHVDRQVAVGLAHARAGHMELAVLTLSNALERTPDEPVLHAALGQLWLDIVESQTRNETQNDHPEALGKALEALGRVASTNAASSRVLTLYGRALLLDDQIDAAERTLRQATERYPVDPAAFLHYAAAAERRKHYEAARGALVRYGLLTPDDPEFGARASRIASLSLRLDDVGAAIEWLQKALATSPNDVHILVSLADAQLRYGDYAAARAIVSRGLDKDPHNAQLLAIARRLP